MEEDDASQSATQQIMDPRRLGHANSGLDDEDLADIFCILHPASVPAHMAATHIREHVPKHTISAQSDVKIHERNGDTQITTETPEIADDDAASCDIVLRLSANVKDPLGGYRFGRNKRQCDVVLFEDSDPKRISNTHFRIYINEYGTIMIEDLSTNGTGVDNILLRAKDKENSTDYRHTLGQGSVIVLTMTPQKKDLVFFVRIPQRDEESENAYQQNLIKYFNRFQNANGDAHRQNRGLGGGTGHHETPNIFATLDTVTPIPSMSSIGRYVQEWRGGSKYNKAGTIGKGAFATVYKVTTKFDGVPFAAKEIEKRRFMKNGVLHPKIDNEMTIMKKLKHVNIVQYIEHLDWKEFFYIIMEYVPGGDLTSLIHRRGHLSEPDVKVMAGQLLSAVKYLHDMQITHRDLKPDNILIYSLNPLHVKLTDFGLSKMLDEETFLNTFCGTLLYCAPEVYSDYHTYDDAGRKNPLGIAKKALHPQRYNDAVDIWSLAGVLFYALCGSAPYPISSNTTYQDLLRHIMTLPLDIGPLQRAKVSDSGIRFVRSMLRNRPEKRATIIELENSSWMGGSDSIEMSVEDDEVNMIGGGCMDPQLQNAASQLSLLDQAYCQIDNSQADGNPLSVSDLTEIQQREIPSSFNTDDNSNESYGLPGGLASPRNGRLFGEVNIAALGSSGAIAIDHLPVLTVNPLDRLPESASSQESISSKSESSDDSSRTQDATQHPRSAAVPIVMPPPPPPVTERTTINHSDADDHATRSSSLMGAESLVGHLNMHSPASASFHVAETSVSAATADDVTVSLRRPREDNEEECEDQPWRPRDLPPKKRRKSEREIDIVVSPSIFWDPRDKTTHHNNYPTISTSDFRSYRQYAEAKGELFQHGQKTFDTAMTSFRSSRSPSMEPEALRARSEPITNDRRRITMKRDERNLGDELAEQLKAIEPQRLTTRDHYLPPTARGSDELVNNTIDNNKLADHALSVTLKPVAGNDFQPPKRILAKILATSDSCLPTLNLSLTENLTSWGRGFKNTFRFANGKEKRVPKYAFKILLFKSGLFNSVDAAANADNQDMSFYISSKATMGIRVNDTKLPSYDPQNPYTPSKYWGELRNGDLLTVWFDDLKPEKSFTRFRFECYWGKSKEIRSPDKKFQIIPEGELLNEVEGACLAQEKLKLAEIEEREKKDRIMREQDRQAWKSGIMGQSDAN